MPLYFFLIVASNSVKHKLPTGSCNIAQTTTVTTTRSTDIPPSTLVTARAHQAILSTSAKTKPTTTRMNALI
jgi:hypothetical protein